MAPGVVADSQNGTNSSSLHLVIIGAGLCGLGAAISTALGGHRVTVFEAASALHEVGAGLQITPNGTRVLRQWGVLDRLAPRAAAPSTFSIYRFDGELLAHRPHYQAELEKHYKSPLWCLYRVDLQDALAKRATELGVEIRLGSRIRNVDFDDAAVVLEDGTKFKGDVVLAADGLWSATRSRFMGHSVLPKPTGDLAYRIMLKADDISDPELRRLVTNPAVRMWIGKDSHAIAYSIHGGRLLNLVLLAPDDLPEGLSKAAGDLGEMRKRFEHWDPVLNQLLSGVTQVEKWRLMHLSPLETWMTPSGSFVLAGDACHPMLPYMAQGANSALEDGATLGAVLARARSKRQIPEALAMYQRLRKPRVEAIAHESFLQRGDFHMGDGPEQQERDRHLRLSFETEDGYLPDGSRW
ncbi:MAG: hypothetical protein M1823_000358 [Watsoniomyces obsoletus]|nr:MAG: hypothetical protein M1823_000358 [Watsoniomyces obsoletus]